MTPEIWIALITTAGGVIGSIVATLRYAYVHIMNELRTQSATLAVLGERSSVDLIWKENIETRLSELESWRDRQSGIFSVTKEGK